MPNVQVMMAKKAISLAKRAGQRRGWDLGTFLLYGKETIRRYKTFLATYKPAGGIIRVVLVKEDNGEWRAYFCTNPEATVCEILEAVAESMCFSLPSESARLALPMAGI